jgi:hypothetical protein
LEKSLILHAKERAAATVSLLSATAATATARGSNYTRGGLVSYDILTNDLTAGSATAHLKAHLLEHLAHRLLLDHAELLVGATLSTGGGRA